MYNFNQDEIRIKAKLRYGDTIRLGSWIGRKLVPIVCLIITLAIYYIIQTISQNKAYDEGFVNIIICLALIAGLALAIYESCFKPSKVYKRVKKIMKRSTLLRINKLVHYTFTDEGITIDTEKVYVDYNWSDIKKIDEFMNIFIILIHGSGRRLFIPEALLLPKRCFNRNGQLPIFENLLSKCLDSSKLDI